MLMINIEEGLPVPNWFRMRRVALKAAKLVTSSAVGVVGIAYAIHYHEINESALVPVPAMAAVAGTVSSVSIVFSIMNNNKSWRDIPSRQHAPSTLPMDLPFTIPESTHLAGVNKQ